MEELVSMAFGDIYRGRRVLLTGHTGFKGSWLAEWLLQLGAQVTGLGLAPDTNPALCEQLGLAGRLDHRIVDLRDPAAVRAVVDDCQPEFAFHLGAQSLVRRSYAEPAETFATNVLGTVHLLEALRRAAAGCVVVAVTTDKCYENHDQDRRFRETDPLGGHDPYSASKAAAEIAISSYRDAFFNTGEKRIRLASARAGNVIGGGDWATDRIVPDCVRALQRGAPIKVRNPNSTRPWQHVIEPLCGYLMLGSALAHDPALAGAYNFGPACEAERTVGELVDEVLRHWPGSWECQTEPGAVHEARLLSLSIDKAREMLGWRPVWDFQQTVATTMEWYRRCSSAPASAGELTRAQIDAYTRAAAASGHPWAQGI